MPGFDRTGPQGGGPLTGGGRGVCSTGGQGVFPGRGFAGRGRGGRRCFGGRFVGGYGRGFQPWAPADELPALKTAAESLKGELAALQARITALESQGEEQSG